MKLDRHMQYGYPICMSVWYISLHMWQTFFLGRKCVKIPHMTKGHICAPQIFQRKWFQSILPHIWGPNIEELYAKIPLTSTYCIHGSWILQQVVWSHVHLEYSLVFVFKVQALGQNFKRGSETWFQETNNFGNLL
jgi:hypothetical protein